jgi:hypothetical protein
METKPPFKVDQKSHAVHYLLASLIGAWNLMFSRLAFSSERQKFWYFTGLGSHRKLEAAMTQIGTTQREGIRELTNEEIAVVVGGSTNGNPLSCIIQTIICKIERFLSCFRSQNL